MREVTKFGRFKNSKLLYDSQFVSRVNLFSIPTLYDLAYASRNTIVKINLLNLNRRLVHNNKVLISNLEKFIELEFNLLYTKDDNKNEIVSTIIFSCVFSMHDLKQLISFVSKAKQLSKIIEIDKNIDSNVELYNNNNNADIPDSYFEKLENLEENLIIPLNRYKKIRIEFKPRVRKYKIKNNRSILLNFTELTIYDVSNPEKERYIGSLKVNEFMTILSALKNILDDYITITNCALIIPYQNQTGRSNDLSSSTNNISQSNNKNADKSNNNSNRDDNNSNLNSSNDRYVSNTDNTINNNEEDIEEEFNSILAEINKKSKSNNIFIDL